MRYQVVPGIRVEAVGDRWAAWSPASGQTHLLNDESAAILEVLGEHGPQNSHEAAGHLARETSIDPEQVNAAIALAWPSLEWAGFVRRVPSPGP